MSLQMIQGMAFIAVPILLSLSVHEFAHARTALAFGDPTAKSRGRCTLNPLAHLHPIGTLMILFAGFGWAKPVPVVPGNLHPRRLGSIAVSAAGPASNLVIAAVCAGVLRIMAARGVTVDITPNAAFVVTDLVVFVMTYTILLNLSLCIFNLLPLFPLDGHHIGRETMPSRLRGSYMQWQRKYGMLLLLALMFGPVLLAAMNVRFDPLRWYYGQTVYPLFAQLVGHSGWALAGNALDKFAGFTAFN